MYLVNLLSPLVGWHLCSRALELFREFDKNSTGYLDRRELTSLVMRIFPEIKRRELRYFRAMLDVEGDGRVSFQSLNEIVKECNHAATLAETKQRTMDQLKKELAKLVKNSRKEAIRVFNEFDLDGRWATHFRNGSVSGLHAPSPLSSLKLKSYPCHSSLRPNGRCSPVYALCVEWILLKLHRGVGHLECVTDQGQS